MASVDSLMRSHRDSIRDTIVNLSMEYVWVHEPGPFRAGLQFALDAVDEPPEGYDDVKVVYLPQKRSDYPDDKEMFQDAQEIESYEQLANASLVIFFLDAIADMDKEIIPLLGAAMTHVQPFTPIIYVWAYQTRNQMGLQFDHWYKIDRTNPDLGAVRRVDMQYSYKELAEDSINMRVSITDTVRELLERFGPAERARQQSNRVPDAGPALPGPTEVAAAAALQRHKGDIKSAARELIG